MSAICKNKFLDDQLRFSLALPGQVIDRFKLFNRSEISPQHARNRTPPKLTKADRVKIGIDKDEKKFAHVPTFVPDYLKLPMNNPSHPIQQQKSRIQALKQSTTPGLSAASSEIRIGLSPSRRRFNLSSLPSVQGGQTIRNLNIKTNETGISGMEQAMQGVPDLAEMSMFSQPQIDTGRP